MGAMRASGESHETESVSYFGGRGDHAAIIALTVRASDTGHAKVLSARYCAPVTACVYSLPIASHGDWQSHAPLLNGERV